MGSVNVSQAVNGRGVSATITWDTGPTVTVTITGNAGYGSRAYWRVTGTNSGGDYSTHYIPQTNNDSGTFDAENGHSYAFQAIWGSENGISNGDVFTVNFDSGGGDPGGGDDTHTSVTLHVNEGEGSKVTVIRTWSNNSNNYYSNTGGVMYKDGVMHDNTIWFDGDFFEIAVEAEDGYELDYYSLNGNTVPFSADNLYYESAGEIISDSRYRLAIDADLTITTTATPISTVRIYNDTSKEWVRYTAFIYNKDSGWNRYTPFVYNGSSKEWVRYS